MEILITDTSCSQYSSSVEMTNGKQKVYISKSSLGSVTILNMNASHKAWRGVGRTFWSFEDAIAAYKSEFMKTAITMSQAYV